jgi:dUTP pyrophosphatase
MKFKFLPHCSGTYSTFSSAGFDIAARCDKEIELSPGDRCLVPTNLFLDIPPPPSNIFSRFARFVDKMFRREALLILPRSGNAINKGITVLNSPGLVDEDYPNEIKVILINHSKEKFVIKNGDKVAQGVVINYRRMRNVPVAAAVRTGGFGSTDRKG